MEGLGSQHLTLFNISTIKKLIKMGESAWPLRPKMAHLLNRSLSSNQADSNIAQAEHDGQDS